MIPMVYDSPTLSSSISVSTSLEATRKQETASAVSIISVDTAQILQHIFRVDPRQVPQHIFPSMVSASWEMEPSLLKALGLEYRSAVEVEYPPTVENVEIMLSLLGSEDCHKEMASDLAVSIAKSWVSGDVSYNSEAVRVLVDWMATAEEYNDPEGLEEMRSAREGLDKGEGIPWEVVRKELDL